ncbi:hypothetical protein GY45DRAFT_1243648, partial [Cubamyces sp. BRFM 1775]
MSCLLFNIAIEPLAAALRSSALRGFSLPGMTEKLVAKLFADDTTVFLSEQDDYSVLTKVTTTWCAGSRAKFNTDKTEVIPVGTREYRQRVLTEQKPGPTSSPFPAGTHICADGEAVRLLGAWVGNKTSPAIAWEPILARIEKNLRRWAKAHLTLRGKQLVVNMEIGGRTQFLAKAQGMTLSVEKKIVSLICAFIWDEGKSPMLPMAQLELPVESGGLGLLNISARNEAIDLMWLKSYLNLSSTRPAWALLADVLMAKAITADAKNVDPEARVNTFLQTWNVSTRMTAGLPTSLKKIVSAAKKHGLRVSVANPTPALKGAMPAWYH